MDTSTGRSLEERVARLEDIEAIKNVKAQYAYYCDKGYQAEGFTSLFTDDAVWESNAFGTYHGKQEIYDFIDGLGKSQILWALHFMICPVVNVAPDGQNATGTWYLLELATMTRPDGDERDAVIMTANYEDTFVKQNGEWKIKHVKVHFHQVSNLDQGWVEQPFRGQ
jgi:limonene-1,2-epoxide hydrolase